MVGYPKYKIGDRVSIKTTEGIKVGIVQIVDAFGTFFSPDEVSYDILIEDENVLYKHCSEKGVTLVTK